MEYVLCSQQPAVDAIVYWLGGPNGASNLRNTCRAAMAAIPPPTRHSNVEWYLADCAKKGDVNGCYHARSIGARLFGGMLYAGADCGHEVICTLAKEWGAAADWNFVLRIGEEMGHENICRLAISNGAKVDADEMMFAGIRMGRENICRLALRYGTTISCEEILFSGAASGNEAICRLAREMGARDFASMLQASNVWVHENICKLAREWLSE